MKIDQLTRKPEAIHQDLKLVNGQYVTTKGCSIVIPERYADRGLATLGAVTELVGIFAIVQGTSYGVSTVNSIFRIKPSRISTFKYNEESYYDFEFDPGAVVFIENQVLKDNLVVYKIFDELINKGNVPWYLNYNDTLTLFRSAAKYAGMDFTKSHSVLEMIAATVCRNTKDMTKYYRHSITTSGDIHKTPPTVIPLNNITYGATNTTSRLMGAYWTEGMTSSLVNPTERVENVEDLLRR